MLDLKDSRWDELLGGDEHPYDPRPAFAALEAETNPEAAWDELWNELHHQGDVGSASYASVPHLLRIHRTRDKPDWQTYMMVGVIEICRCKPNNPRIPPDLQASYEDAWQEVVPMGTRDLTRSSDPTLGQSILGVLALARGLRATGELLLEFSEDEMSELMSKLWSL